MGSCPGQRSGTVDGDCLTSGQQASGTADGHSLTEPRLGTAAWDCPRHSSDCEPSAKPAVCSVRPKNEAVFGAEETKRGVLICLDEAGHPVSKDEACPESTSQTA